MADTQRPASDHLSFFRRAADAVNRYGFFALLRQAEARARALPRIGRSRLPGQNVADLAHTSSLGFPGPTLESIEFGKTGRAQVSGYFLGLTGPMGPLPLHLTEFAHYERHYSPSRPFESFLDLLTDRMLQFFYRAWADSQPAAQADRPEDDRFGDYLAQLAGVLAAGSGEHVFPYHARIHYLGIFASRRSPAALQDCLSHLIGTPVRVREFLPLWRDIASTDRTRLSREHASCALGNGAVLGSRVRVADDTFTVAIHARDFRVYRDYLPTGSRFAIVREAIGALSPSHLEWRLELEIDENQIEGATLDGATQLGWNSWLAPRKREVIRTDARLNRASHTLGRHDRREGGHRHE